MWGTIETRYVAVSGCDFLIKLQEMGIATSIGKTCAMATRKFAGPSVMDSAILGRANDANAANARTAAFVATSFFRASLFIRAPFLSVAIVTVGGITHGVFDA